MDMVINKLIKYLSSEIRVIFSYLLKKYNFIYSLPSLLLPPKAISDFFVWSPNFEKIFFIAENANALLSGEKKSTTHVFKFFSSEGELIKKLQFQSDDFISEFELGLDIDNLKDRYISFVHFNTYSVDNFTSYDLNNLKSREKIIRQSRGYTKFYNRANELGSLVHGNIGGITSDLKMTARQRELFLYTPVYNFESDNSYDLVFNNPSPKKLIIKLISKDELNLHTIFIKPMGTKFFHLRKYNGLISIESKLPICRPLIFKNPPPKNFGFDVFHG